MKIDITNRYLVGARGDGIVIGLPPVAPMTKEQALVLAAYLVLLADDSPDEFHFDKIVDTVAKGV